MWQKTFGLEKWLILKHQSLCVYNLMRNCRLLKKTLLKIVFYVYIIKKKQLQSPLSKRLLKSKGAENRELEGNEKKNHTCQIYLGRSSAQRGNRWVSQQVVNDWMSLMASLRSAGRRKCWKLQKTKVWWALNIYWVSL